MKERHYSMVGYGFHIPKYVINQMKKNTKLFEEFQESHYSYPTDALNADTSEYFFGLVINTVYPTHMNQFDIPVLCPDELYRKMFKEYKYFFPDMYENNYIPTTWIISGVD